MNPFDDTQISQQSFAYGDLTGGDRWDTWSPIRTGWTDVGTPTISARHHVIGRQCFIQIKVVPATSIATVAGTSYISLPFAAKGYTGDASMGDLTSLISIGDCVFDTTNSRLYLPTQTATAHTLTIGGWFEF